MNSERALEIATAIMDAAHKQHIQRGTALSEEKHAEYVKYMQTGLREEFRCTPSLLDER
jgi:hypothetical protein